MDQWALGRTAGATDPPEQDSGLLWGVPAWSQGSSPSTCCCPAWGSCLGPTRVWGLARGEAGLGNVKVFVVARVKPLTRMLRQRRQEVWLPPQGCAASSSWHPARQ